MDNDWRSRSNAAAAAKRGIQLKQFVVSLVLFLTVLIGKGFFPAQTEAFFQGALEQLTRNTDLRGALDKLGTAVQGSSSVMDGLEDFCSAVFGPGPESNQGTEDTPVQTMLPDSSPKQEVQFLSTQPSPSQLVQHYRDTLHAPIETDALTAQTDAEESPAPSQEEAPIVSAGTVLEQFSCQGEDPPEHCTMDHISLGNLETMTPVMGPLSSKYGYRSHPTNGEHRFHKGTDIAADEGTPILAFADGTVEFIGANNSFGQYIQLDHGNGIKSLYAHCSKLCASKGDSISRGDQIALVGSTGDSTGPHLHLELKYQDTNLNPAYYVEFTNQP